METEKMKEEENKKRGEEERGVGMEEGDEVRVSYKDTNLTLKLLYVCNQ